MECSNCGKKALFEVHAEGGSLFLCLDCNLKYEQAQQLEFDRNARLINALGRQIDLATGIPGLGPRIAPRENPLVQTGDIVLTNIQVNRSTVGVLNTGSIGSVDAALTVIKRRGEADVATAITNLTEAIVSSTQASAEAKNKILEILSILSNEATAPKPERRSLAMRPLLAELANICSGISDLSQIWVQYGPLVASLFA